MTIHLAYISATLFLAFSSALAAPPAAPQNVCIEHASGTDCASIDPNVSSGTTVTAVAPKSVNPNNFHPGFYYSVGENTGSSSSAFGVLANTSSFVGGKRFYSWRSIEPQEGKYDFSLIEQDLNYLQSIGKRLWIQIKYTQFNGNLEPNTPKYMWGNIAYGCDSRYYGAYERVVQEGGWLPCFWNKNVKSRFNALYAALGARFNKEPFFEGITIDETAINGKAAEIYPEFSAQAVKTAFQENALAAKKAFPDKSITQWINSAPYDLSDFAEWLAQNGIGIGSPDTSVLPEKTISLDYIKYHDLVPTGPEVSWPDQAKVIPALGRPYTAQEFIDIAVDYTNSWYLFWRAREPYFSNDVLPTLSKSNTALPAAREFYNSQK